MAEKRRQELLEIYKLHAELTDRVSQRRLQTNRMYVSLLVGLMLFAGAMLRIGESLGQDRLLFPGVGVVGILLATSWYFIIRSYQQLNGGKFKVLQELERNLAYDCFSSEWKILREGKDGGHYRMLTKVECALPCTFLLLFIAVLGFGVFEGFAG